jgi:predicted metal-dependent phosphoesterase TrpH
MIDLHTHSTASDGTLAPGELVAEAGRAGLSAIALTDHDTVAGVEEFMAAATTVRPRAIPGVEIACSWYGGTLHVVGLFVDHTHVPLLRLLERIRCDRATRNERILARLAGLNCPVQLAEVVAVAGEGVVGRPHIAEALVRRGHCRDAKDAFARLLGEGQPAYVRRFLPLPEAAIAAIHAAGGVAVWAHPVGMKDLPPAKVRQVAVHLRDLGLDAVEVFYSEYTREQEESVRRIARDFHGANSPGIQLGRGRGGLAVPDGFVRLLQARARGCGPEG